MLPLVANLRSSFFFSTVGHYGNFNFDISAIRHFFILTANTKIVELQNADNNLTFGILWFENFSVSS